jgi:RimJ/RimL family protein N-acetyltransferase
MNEQLSAHGQPIGPPVPGWRERARPQRIALTGRYCRVAPINVERDAPALFAAYMQAPDGRDWTYLAQERPVSAASFREYLAKIAASADPLHYAIVDLASGLAIGTAALMRIEPAHGVIEVGGITYSPALKKTRASSEAMYLLMRYIFDELGYRRYEWKCDSLNAPSRAAAQRYGFRFEGIFRQAIVYKGRSRDTAWFSIIDAEWPRIRTAFETWLNPENFDAAGQQRQPLAAIRDGLAPPEESAAAVSNRAQTAD